MFLGSAGIDLTVEEPGFESDKAESYSPGGTITKESIENAIRVLMATGGSTNLVIHLIAIARRANIDLKLEDFERISNLFRHINLLDTYIEGKHPFIRLSYRESLELRNNRK